MTVRPAVLLTERGHALLLHYRYGGSNVYQLPGGNPDPGETLPQTLVRELREELAVAIEVGPLLLMGEVQRPGSPDAVLHCVFAGQIIGGVPVPQPGHTKALAAVWQPLARLPALHLYPNVGAFLAEARRGYVGKIEQVWEGFVNFIA